MLILFRPTGCVFLQECEYSSVNILKKLKNPNNYDLLDFGLIYLDIKLYFLYSLLKMVDDFYVLFFLSAWVLDMLQF
jgi:hypothetical protein